MEICTNQREPGIRDSTSESWWSSPEWLPHHERWLENPMIEKSETSEVEAKVVKEILAVAHANETDDSTDNIFKDLPKRHDLQRTIRIQAWVVRFTTCRHRKGPLTPGDLRKVTQ